MGLCTELYPKSFSKFYFILKQGLVELLSYPGQAHTYDPLVSASYSVRITAHHHFWHFFMSCRGVNPQVYSW